MKVLQIVERLHRGSVERWLLRTYLHAQRMGVPFEWTFYCSLPEQGELDDAATAADARVVHSPVPLADKVAFLAALRREIRRGGYDIIHSHHDFLSAFYYVASIGCHCRRVTHVHNTDEALPTANRIKHAMALGSARLLCLSMSDTILGTSEHALRKFLGDREPDPIRHRPHYCSIELDDYWSQPPDRAGVRAELGLDKGATLMLFVGTMIDLKNPVFLVEMLAEMVRVDATVAAVFAGDGPDRARVVERARQLGVAERVRVLGWRGDIIRLMQASDLFVNPRREEPPEGFGIVNLEAQAAGLRALVSDGISLEPLLAGAIHARVPLAAGPAAWGKAARELLNTPPLPLEKTKQILLGCRSNPEAAVTELYGIYAGLMRRTAGSEDSLQGDGRAM